ncbi:hypothetical protein CN633_32035 [Bacillus toyonensis]|nr:hypothetical protein CN633_32035 [Bacillus toyonensis]
MPGVPGVCGLAVKDRWRWRAGPAGRAGLCRARSAVLRPGRIEESGSGAGASTRARESLETAHDRPFPSRHSPGDRLAPQCGACRAARALS